MRICQQEQLMQKMIAMWYTVLGGGKNVAGTSLSAVGDMDDVIAINAAFAEEEEDININLSVRAVSGIAVEAFRVC